MPLVSLSLGEGLPIGFPLAHRNAVGHYEHSGHKWTVIVEALQHIHTVQHSDSAFAALSSIYERISLQLYPQFFTLSNCVSQLTYHFKKEFMFSARLNVEVNILDVPPCSFNSFMLSLKRYAF